MSKQVIDMRNWPAVRDKQAGVEAIVILDSIVNTISQLEKPDTPTETEAGFLAKYRAAGRALYEELTEWSLRVGEPWPQAKDKEALLARESALWPEDKDE